MKFTNFTYTLLAITLSAQEIPVVPQEVTAPSQGIPMIPQGGNVVPQEITAPSQTTPIVPREIIEPPTGDYGINQVIVDPFPEINDSSKEKCFSPFGGVGISAFFSNMEFSCSNFNRDTGCNNGNYKIPNKNASPGGCKLRNEPPVMDAIVRNYDCRSAGNHWNFASEMVNRYNLICNFIKKSPYY